MKRTFFYLLLIAFSTFLAGCNNSDNKKHVVTGKIEEYALSGAVPSFMTYGDTVYVYKTGWIKIRSENEVFIIYDVENINDFQKEFSENKNKKIQMFFSREPSLDRSASTKSNILKINLVQ